MIYITYFKLLPFSKSEAVMIPSKKLLISNRRILHDQEIWCIHTLVQGANCTIIIKSDA